MTLRRRLLWVLATAVVICAIAAAGLVVHVGAVEGAPAQTPWQYLGPATTANP
jgi:hypothetical protein